MTSVASLYRRVTRLENELTFKPEDKVFLHIWLPENDPRHNMTKTEIIEIAAKNGNRVIMLPLCEEDLTT
ncbi:hypothetical protein KAU55_00540 [Candidatus Bathyarchaeota archaeon]|nr:hypothetical protein [Candidatus Bathyarchaeota archaeon]